MRGLKQEALASELGEEWTQRRISLLEAKETVEPDILQSVADVLKIPVEVFQNLKDDDHAVNIISNTFDHGAILNGINYDPTFHPIEKIAELHEEKIALYERMLKEKDEMIARLEKLMNKE